MDRADAISVIKDIHAEMEDARDNIAVEALDIAIKEIERPRGEWILTNNPNYSPFDETSEKIKTCSQCGYSYATKKMFNFCPNCGANMVGDKK